MESIKFAYRIVAETPVSPDWLGVGCGCAECGAIQLTHRERITSIADHSEVSRDEAVRTLEDALGSWVDAEEGVWTEEELERARGIAESKFRNEQWNRNGEDPTAT